MTYLLGVDVGTTAVKVVVFDDQGLEIGSASEEYKLLTPSDVEVELDADVYWTSTVKCIRAVLDATMVFGHDIRALAVSSQGESFVPIDSHGQPLRRTIVWLDNRSSEEARLIERQFGAERVYEVTGSPEVVPTWAATKILWLKRHEPDVFEKVHKYLFLEDYLIFRLTGELVAEYALYTSSLLLDIRRFAWWQDMLDFVGITSEHLPTLVDPGRVVGRLSDEAAAATGLSADTVVVSGGMDQACVSVGSGNTKPGVITDSTGSSLNICVTTDRLVIDPTHRVPIQCHAIKGKYIVLPWCTTAGMALRWFRDQFCDTERRQALETDTDAYDIMTAEAEAIPPGSEGLILLPHFAGAMCPEFNERARGAFFGMALKHTRAHFIRATMEAVAFMLKRNLDLIQQMGLEAEEVRVIGGGAKSALWNQIKADVTQRPVLVLRNPEAACLGAAILAGVAIGVFESVDVACRTAVLVKARVAPDSSNERVYAHNYGMYVKLYDTLEKAFWRKG
ncbi:MAG: hypothetical protein GX620_02250 [Chloroflexi bacterium]|nr:hypothetical protein [Chloroflexota bacterium]